MEITFIIVTYVNQKRNTKKEITAGRQGVSRERQESGFGAGRFDFDGPRWYNEDRFAAMRTGKENNKRGGTALDIGLILGELFSGVTYLFSVEGLKTLVMFVIAGVLIYLAIKRTMSRRCCCPSALARFWPTCRP